MTSPVKVELDSPEAETGSRSASASNASTDSSTPLSKAMLPTKIKPPENVGSNANLECSMKSFREFSPPKNVPTRRRPGFGSPTVLTANSNRHQTEDVNGDRNGSFGPKASPASASKSTLKRVKVEQVSHFVGS